MFDVTVATEMAALQSGGGTVAFSVFATDFQTSIVSVFNKTGPEMEWKTAAVWCI